MIEIEDKTIKVSRGDAVEINFSIPISSSENYTFQIGDIITFRIFNKNGYDKQLKEVQTTITEATTNAVITLLESDTTLGDISQKPLTFWYEISLNEVQTCVGYDSDGPAEFIIFPAKGGD